MIVNCDLTILFGTYREGKGNVIATMMSCKTPLLFDFVGLKNNELTFLVYDVRSWTLYGGLDEVRMTDRANRTWRSKHPDFGE